MTLTVATKEQLPIIQDLAYKIWPHTYGATHTQEELDYMLTKFYAVPSLEQQQAAGHTFILAEEAGEFQGFVAYELHAEGTSKTKIHKLYVLPQTQGKGLGRQLVDYVKEQALLAHDQAICLNVNKHNTAQVFYSKYGFNITQDILIDIGEGFVMDDYVMEVVLGGRQ